MQPSFSFKVKKKKKSLKGRKEREAPLHSTEILCNCTKKPISQVEAVLLELATGSTDERLKKS